MVLSPLVFRRGMKSGATGGGDGDGEGRRSNKKGPRLDPPDLERASTSSSSSASSLSSGSASTGCSIDNVFAGLKTPSARRAVRFDLDEPQNVKCLVHEDEDEDDGKDEEEGGGDRASARSSRKGEIRRQKDLAALEAREYARDHPEYVRALELLLNSPVHPVSFRTAQAHPNRMDEDPIQLIGTACSVRGLEGHCTPALSRHRKWAIQTVLHVHRQQQLRQRKHSTSSSGGGGGCGGGDDDDDESLLLLLRRSCEFVSRGAGELAVAIGAADAWAIRNEAAPR
jgi:hypothetical protein